MLCDAMRCDAMRCDAMRCDAMLCYAMLCYAMLCYAMFASSNASNSLVKCNSAGNRAPEGLLDCLVLHTFLENLCPGGACYAALACKPYACYAMLPAIHWLNSILLAIERRWACLIASFCTHFTRICVQVLLATPLWRANPMLAMLACSIAGNHGLNSILLAIERWWACLIASFCTHFSRIAPPGRPFGGHGRSPGGPMEAPKILGLHEVPGWPW